MKKVMLAVVCAAMVMVSCNKKSKEIDQNIDKFETVVKEYCNAMESGDLTAAEACTAKLQEAAEALKDTAAMSQEQKDRLKEIGMKMLEVSMNAVNAQVDNLNAAVEEADQVLDEAAAELDEAIEEAADVEE